MKRLTAILLILITGGSYAQYDKIPIFTEEFADNSYDWATQSTVNKTSFSLYNGYYYFGHLRDERGWASSKSVKIDDTRDFEIEARIKKISGVENFGYGIIWGRKDSENQFSYQISGNGYFRVMKYQGDIIDNLIKWTRTSYINTGNGATNTLTIQKTGYKMKFYVNGNYLAELSFQSFMGDRMGFIIYKRQKIGVDYLRVSYLEEQTQERWYASDVDVNIPVTSTRQFSTYALIIGNEDYSSQQKGLTTEQNVDFAVNDAEVFAKYCEKTLGIPEKQIKVLKNATTAQIYQGLAWISNLAAIEEGKAKLIFYYSGHGLPHEQTKEAYIMPVDVSGNHIDYAVKVNEVYKKLTEHPSKQVTVFLDACFSGGARNQGLIAMKGVKIAPKENTVPGSLVVFSSSTGEESSAVYTKKQHGYFTYFLLKKLKETHGDVNLDELSNYIIQAVRKETALGGKIQTPQVNVSPAVGNQWENWGLK